MSVRNTNLYETEKYIRKMPPTDELLSEYPRQQMHHEEEQPEGSLEDKLLQWPILQVAGKPWSKALRSGTNHGSTRAIEAEFYHTRQDLRWLA